jgi:hypothetical protein
VPPGWVIVVEEVTVLVEVVVVVEPQAFIRAIEPTVAPPTIRPASLRNSLREMCPFFFSSDMVFVIKPPFTWTRPRSARLRAKNKRLGY